MKSLIITVAGMSSRFNRDTKEDVLKCLYYEDIPANSLLSLQIQRTYDRVDEIVVVGGYKYEDLVQFIGKEIQDPDHKIRLVYNDHFQDYGSCYSLLMGLDAVSEEADEIIFIEGDLLFDSESVVKIIDSRRDVISVNSEPILSNKAVALYFDAGNCPHYIYDTRHSCLEIHEPFTAIYNSGQMWKFMDPEKVRKVCLSLTPEQQRGTNLEIVQRYFGTLRSGQLDIVRMGLWYNCNTVSDYREAVKTVCR